MSARLPAKIRPYIEAGEFNVIYEQPIRDLLVASEPGTFHYEDISGLAWIEIDFPADLERANGEVLAKLAEVPAKIP